VTRPRIGVKCVCVLGVMGGVGHCNRDTYTLSCGGGKGMHNENYQ
jgi:hypothetical protein